MPTDLLTIIHISIDLTKIIQYTVNTDFLNEYLEFNNSILIELSLRYVNNKCPQYCIINLVTRKQKQCSYIINITRLVSFPEIAINSDINTIINIRTVVIIIITALIYFNHLVIIIIAVL